MLDFNSSLQLTFPFEMEILDPNCEYTGADADRLAGTRNDLRSMSARNTFLHFTVYRFFRTDWGLDL